ncbi:uncharacterized protein LOC125261445 isoform X3 [Megalobrama amblycephala]|uniref:uncharacterized protein LOC125244799 isoform X3 n=1 Tax=Megalobrama amblycephala TaxID=75352 RepID=UPI0020143D88|nr:uncharacterized protein LOC125244799 isoform X3 [Megalobrama amblycephala]XP_048011073.1 uncharacterized protein LOC125244799 isoform X3 [Megalobrama amblycephala]XP_048011083.1 uncharacterized protein LOC125244799 isoform X3 [Megalobrama amblycephala]XP_048011094.1 uncharacterized protein LOC125244799 isoform X3 [Megalobrama amblycephala]XP_048011104.1 uncharacterized protein LOC125244799 isoform X3 [Megalobrama amblycephala]XP_048035963.1 uncharacterized protein LOC125261445 isoform X3 [M
MESEMRYAVIKFPQDNTVDVVPSNWLEVTKEAIYCYWPRKNFTAKAKRRDTPDTTFWSKHVAVVMVYADSYEEARLKANQATVTSNLESDEEPSRRPVRPPARYRRQLDSGDDEDSPPPPKTRILSTPKFTPRKEYFGERCHLSVQEPETAMSDRETQHEADVTKDVPASAGETNLYNTELKKVERAIIVRLDKMDQRMSAIETLLRSVAQPSDISEFLIKPCQRACRNWKICAQS